VCAHPPRSIKSRCVGSTLDVNTHSSNADLLRFNYLVTALAFTPCTSTHADWMMPISLHTRTGTTITTEAKSYAELHKVTHSIPGTEFVP
jgi:hypothetical protein